MWPFLNRVKTLFYIKKFPTIFSLLISLATRGFKIYFSSYTNEARHRIDLFLLSQG